MHSKKKKNEYRLVYTLGEHPYLGYLIEPHAVLLNANGELSFTHHRLFSGTADDYGDILDDTDRKLIKLLDEVEQSHIIKRYYKKVIRPADYFAKIFDKALYDIIRPHIETRLLKAMELLRGKPFYLMGKEGYPADQELKIAAEPASVLFHFRRNEVETRYFPTIKFEGHRIEFMFRDAQVVINQQAWLLLENVVYYFDQPLEGKKLSPFLQKRYISVPRATEYKYFEMFVCGLIERHHVYAEGFDIKTYQHEAVPVLKIDPSDKDNRALELKFQYGPYLISSASDTRVTVRMEYDETQDHYTFHRIRRSLQWEQKKKDELLAMGLEIKDRLFDTFRLAGEAAGSEGAKRQTIFDWVQKHQEMLKAIGFQIRQEEGLTRYYFGQASLSFEISAGNDWFDIHAVARFGEFEVPFIRLKESILNGEREFTLPNGEIVLIPEEWLARYSQLFHFAAHRDGLKLKKHHVGLLDEISELQEVTMDRKLQKLEAFEGMQDIQEPVGLKGTLRPYQQAAFNWFYFLQSYRFGGCLADDMGLGKTIQTLALLQKEKEKHLDSAGQQGDRRVSLVIMPTSLLYNWQREAEKFVPDLRLLIHTGLNRTKDAEDFQDYDVIITTYGIARVDEELFKSFYFHYIILDESQHIKNPSSKSFKVVRDLKSTFRLVLSGTPIENSVNDLWSQMTFLNPGLLGSHSYFQKEFVVPIEKKHDEEMQTRLQALIKPFILRRTKEQVAKELPPKFEQVVYCDMDQQQEEFYERTKSEYRNELLEGINNPANAEGKSRKKSNQIMLLKGLTMLRQIANHPVLITPDYEGSSGKFEQVLLKLENVLKRGNKVLIFSQFVKQLSLFRAYFDRENIPYAYLDGATNNRDEVIQRFQQDDQVRTFLISIKAGGVGLNLTEADYVFVLDPWWNPAVEQQAIDRAHRIGQQRPVFIYKFISKETVEEKILTLQERKTKLAGSFITTEESFFKSLTVEDIQSLLE